jgi:hypothetical protein
VYVCTHASNAHTLSDEEEGRSTRMHVYIRKHVLRHLDILISSKARKRAGHMSVYVCMHTHTNSNTVSGEDEATRIAKKVMELDDDHCGILSLREYAYTYACTCAFCITIYIHLYVYACVCVYIYIYIRVCIYIYIRVYVCVCVCVYVK